MASHWPGGSGRPDTEANFAVQIDLEIWILKVILELTLQRQVEQICSMRFSEQNGSFSCSMDLDTRSEVKMDLKDKFQPFW